MTTPYVGEIRLLSFPRIPNGWLACDGSTQSISQYEVLYTLLGTTYGGNGTSTFGLPDLRGQVPLHQGTGTGLTPRTPGQTGGAEAVTLTQASMPAHTHPYNAINATATTTTPSTAVQLGAPTANDKMYTTDITGLSSYAMATSSSNMGGNQPHDNTMPTLTVSFCIAYAGVFPSQS